MRKVFCIFIMLSIFSLWIIYAEEKYSIEFKFENYIDNNLVIIELGDILSIKYSITEQDKNSILSPEDTFQLRNLDNNTISIKKRGEKTQGEVKFKISEEKYTGEYKIHYIRNGENAGIASEKIIVIRKIKKIFDIDIHRNDPTIKNLEFDLTKKKGIEIFTAKYTVSPKWEPTNWYLLIAPINEIKFKQYYIKVISIDDKNQKEIIQRIMFDSINDYAEISLSLGKHYQLIIYDVQNNKEQKTYKIILPYIKVEVYSGPSLYKFDEFNPELGWGNGIALNPFANGTITNDYLWFKFILFHNIKIIEHNDTGEGTKEDISLNIFNIGAGLSFLNCFSVGIIWEIGTEDLYPFYGIDLVGLFTIFSP